MLINFLQKTFNMNKNFFKNKTILITGGTGSYGQALVSYFCNNKFPLKKLIIFSRDEYKQFVMDKIYDQSKHTFLRYFIGDIRDKDRLKIALRDVDFVFHAAALKQVDTAEYNPFEFVKTNVIGSQNLVEACLDSNVKKVLAISTDKASSPSNLYGATKLCSDKIFTVANNMIGKKTLKFSVLRYGNVMGSRGSVLNEFIEQNKKGLRLNVKNKLVTRFHVSLEEAVNFSIQFLTKMVGGEIFIPKLKSYHLIDLAKIISKKIRISNLSHGEKVHEEMISESEMRHTYASSNFFVIVTPLIENKYKKLKRVNNLKSYNSSDNIFLSTNQLKKIVKNFIR